MSLTNTQKKFLKKSAHHLKPIVWAGQHGVTENLIKEIDQALHDHELIKIKLRLGEREETRCGY